MIFHIASMYAYVMICVSVDICDYNHSHGIAPGAQLRQTPHIWRTAACKSTWPERPFHLTFFCASLL